MAQLAGIRCLFVYGFFGGTLVSYEFSKKHKVRRSWTYMSDSQRYLSQECAVLEKRNKMGHPM